jgi:hypothetical protein
VIMTVAIREGKLGIGALTCHRERAKVPLDPDV